MRLNSLQKIMKTLKTKINQIEIITNNRIASVTWNNLKNQGRVKTKETVFYQRKAKQSMAAFQCIYNYLWIFANMCLYFLSCQCLRTKKQQNFENIHGDGPESPEIKHVSSPTDDTREKRSFNTDRIQKPRPTLSDSFNVKEEDHEFDVRLPLQTPDFKGRIELGEQKTSTRANPVPIEEGDQEYQE